MLEPELDYRYDDEASNLLDFCSDRQLCILNDGQVTRLAPELDRRDSAIDLVIVSSNLFSSCEFYVLDNTCGSDHLPILTNTKFSIRKSTQNNDRKWNFKKATNENWAAFREECRLKITCTTESDVNASFTKLLEQLSDILNSTMPKYRFKDTKSCKTVPWWTNECTAAAKKRENLRRNYKKDKKSLAKLKLWHDARRDAKKLFKKAKKASWRDFCAKININTTSKDLWAFIQKVRGHNPPLSRPFNVNGNLITDPHKKTEILADTYAKTSSNDGYSIDFINKKSSFSAKINNIIKNEKPHTELNYNKPFSMLELDTALSTCGKGAPGEDGINYDIIKQLPPETKLALLSLFNNSWDKGNYPKHGMTP